MRFFVPLVLLSSCAVAADLPAVEIVRRAAEREGENAKLRRQYTYRESMLERIANKKGELRNEDQKTHEVIWIGGQEFRRLVEKDGRPLSEKEAAKEQTRLDREIEKYKRETPAAAAKRLAKERREEEEFREQFVKGFDFKVVGEEPISGRLCYRIHAEPKPGMSFKGDAKLLSKVRGDLWIDKERYHWARLDAETIDTITALGGLLRVAKGTTLKVTRTFVNNEVWFPDRIQAQANAKAAFLFSAGVKLEMVFSDFKKYSVESNVTLTEQ